MSSLPHIIYPHTGSFEHDTDPAHIEIFVHAVTVPAPGPVVDRRMAARARRHLGIEIPGELRVTPRDRQLRSLIGREVGMQRKAGVRVADDGRGIGAVRGGIPGDLNLATGVFAKRVIAPVN